MATIGTPWARDPSAVLSPACVIVSAARLSNSSCGANGTTIAALAALVRGVDRDFPTTKRAERRGRHTLRRSLERSALADSGEFPSKRRSMAVRPTSPMETPGYRRNQSHARDRCNESCPAAAHADNRKMPAAGRFAPGQEPLEFALPIAIDHDRTRRTLISRMIGRAARRRMKSPSALRQRQIVPRR